MERPAKEPRRILAPNPSPLTGPGTNSWLIGSDHVAVIDPGPDDPDHVRALLAAGQGRITHIFVTHAHNDHSGAAPALSQATGAPVLAFGGALDGRSGAMRRLAASGHGGGGEGLDLSFRPDIVLHDGQVIETPDWQLRAWHTPGHAASHLCLGWEDHVFCGDLLLAWATTLISPPDGDLTAFLNSLDRVEALAPARLWPGHGEPITQPLARINALREHRRSRTAQILAALSDGPAHAADLARRLYDVPAVLLPAATRNVLAHLIALDAIGAGRFDGQADDSTMFSRN